jgi:macrodomain Ter protein organizer (MatP/YcbG family)
MKSSYYLNIDLVSKRKFTQEDLEKIKNSLELNEDFFDLCSILAESISMNFSSHIEIYVEDAEFDSDKLNEVEEFVNILDSTISGGWERF